MTNHTTFDNVRWATDTAGEIGSGEFTRRIEDQTTNTETEFWDMSSQLSTDAKGAHAQDGRARRVVALRLGEPLELMSSVDIAGWVASVGTSLDL